MVMGTGESAITSVLGRDYCWPTNLVLVITCGALLFKNFSLWVFD